MLLHLQFPIILFAQNRGERGRYDLEEAEFLESLKGADTFGDTAVVRLYHV